MAFYQLCPAPLPYNRRVKKPRLLLVDDDPLIVETLAFALAGDYEVAIATDRGAPAMKMGSVSDRCSATSKPSLIRSRRP